MVHIMIVEDDKKMNEGIRLALAQEGYVFTACRTLQEARAALKGQRMDLILLDVNLPDGNGIGFVREIRKSYDTPVILLTVNNMELDIVMGLEAGANDYITKPFSLMVLRARAGVQLRAKETTKKAAGKHFRYGDLDFDFDAMQFFKNGRPLELSMTEQKILKILCGNGGAVVKRSYLIDTVWSGDTEYVDGHALTVAIKRLRDKLAGATGSQEYIKTVYGIGYTWVGQ